MPLSQFWGWQYFIRVPDVTYSERLGYAVCRMCQTIPVPPEDIAAITADPTEEGRRRVAKEKKLIIGRKREMCRHLKSHCPNVAEDVRQRAIESLKQVEAGTGERAGRRKKSTAGMMDASASTAAAAEAEVTGAQLQPPAAPVRPLPDILIWLQTARSLAKDAGARIAAVRASGNPDAMIITQKTGNTDIVTNSDIAAQQAIFNGLAAAFPTHHRIGEEDSEPQILSEAPTWIVDPIDGTTNYTRGLTDVAVCIALSVDRAIVLGVVFNPFRNEMFHAVRGGGAFLNDKPIHASDTASLHSATVVCEWGYERSPGGIELMLAGARRLLLANVRAMRQLGSGALDMCYVACGRVDAVYTGLAGEGWKIWDYAAAGVIAEEAGANISDIQGNAFRLNSQTMICSAPNLAMEFVSTLRP